MKATSLRAFGCAILILAGIVENCWSEPLRSRVQTDAEKAAELVRQGVELDRKGELDKLIELYTKAIRLDESHVNAYFRRGLNYLLTGQPTKALPDSEKTIKLAPQLGVGYWLRGAVHGNSGKLDEAFADYEKAIQLDPRLAQAYFGRGLVYRSRGELEKAHREFDEALRLEPEDPYMHRVHDKIHFELSQQRAVISDFRMSEPINVSNNSGRSIHPVIAKSRDGSIHLVWMDDTSGNFDIYYASWNGEEWTAGEKVSSDSTPSIFPTATVDLAGQIHVAWMDEVLEDDQHLLHNARKNLKWLKPTSVSTAKGISQHPRIAVDSAGVLHLVWYGNQGGFFELYHSRFVDSRWTEPRNTGLVEWYVTHNPDWSMKPALAAGPDGSIHIAWVGMEDVPSPYALTQNIRHSRWNGTTWSEPDNVSKYSDIKANLESPDIAVDQNADLHVVWEDRGSVWYAKFDGGNWSSPTQINPSGLESTRPTVCCAETGPLYFAWLGAFKDKPQVFFRRLTGEQWSETVNVSKSSGMALGPNLGLDRSGQLHMVWMDDETGEFEIIHRRIASDN